MLEAAAKSWRGSDDFADAWRTRAIAAVDAGADRRMLVEDLGKLRM